MGARRTLCIKGSALMIREMMMVASVSLRWQRWMTKVSLVVQRGEDKILSQPPPLFVVQPPAPVPT